MSMPAEKRKRPARWMPALLCFFLLSGQTPVCAETAAEKKNRGSDIEETALVFRNAELRDVLSLIADEYDLNIVMSDEVRGTVSLRLKGTSLNNTLDALLIPQGFDYEIRDNIIRVASAEVIQAERNNRLAKLDLEPLATEVLVLRYLDANDVKPTVQSMLTARGTVTVLEQRPFKGFQFGAQSTQSSGASSSGSSTTSGSSATGALIRTRAAEDKPRSNTLMIVDVRSQIERIKAVIEKVDIPPRQILIDAKILEVDTKSLEDLGIDFNHRSTIDDRPGTSFQTDLNSGDSDTDIDASVFSNIFPTSTDAGLHTIFRRLDGDDFNVILHTLLQDQHTKTLSAPKILTIENQEAAILVGEQFPIFEASVTDQGTTTETLSFYQPIGISLQVICQVSAEEDIHMIIHPTVSSVGNFVTGTSGLQQPRINIREADTRVLIRQGQTLVIGGLLEDVVDEKLFKVPLLAEIPVIGKVFTRRQTDVDQRNLLIFITPSIVEGPERRLSEKEARTYQGINDPDGYGTLDERREVINRIYRSAQENYKRKDYDTAQVQFLKILSIDPDHAGTIRYLRKMNSIPAEK